MQGTPYHDHVEVKMWHYDTDPDYGYKEFKGTEFISVEYGSLEITLEDAQGKRTSVILDGATRDYIIIPPGYKKNVRPVKIPTEGACVRWFSATE